MSEFLKNTLAENGDEPPLLSHEESVFLLAKQGHLSAQSQIVEWNQTMLRGFVAVLCADLSVSDDLAQTVFIRALQRLDRVEIVSDFPAFLRGIARNVVREHFKKSRRRQANTERFLKWSEEGWEVAQESEATEQEPNLRHHLQVCLQRLTERARKLFLLRYEDDYSSVETGKMVGMSPVAVRKAVSRTRQSLLTCIKEKAV